MAGRKTVIMLMCMVTIIMCTAVRVSAADGYTVSLDVSCKQNGIETLAVACGEEVQKKLDENEMSFSIDYTGPKNGIYDNVIGNLVAYDLSSRTWKYDGHVFIFKAE